MSKKSGFTLIEMAIVIVVIGLLLSGGLTVAASQSLSSQRTENNKRMDIVEHALRLYVMQHACLPCPASGSEAESGALGGVSQNTSGAYVTATTFCTSTACVQGVLPYRSLGLSRHEAFDAWGNAFTYAVGTGLAGTAAMERALPAVYPVGDLDVNASESAAAAVTDRAAYVLLSHGPDGAFAWTPHGSQRGNTWNQVAGGAQFENSDGDSEFRQGGELATKGTDHFDDVVRFMTGPMLIQLCGKSACGNPDE